MSDDSFYDIKNAKVIYKSNNPSALSVNEKGKVTATGVGTALIFAYVTVDGVTLSNNYPLKVMPDLTPKSITVNGKGIRNFDQKVKAYSYLLKSSSKIPVVKAAPTGKDITVDITQAKGVPGTAVIELIDNITLEKNIYYINFGVKSLSDEFNDSSVGKQWEWIRENPVNKSLTKKAGSLSITSEEGDISEAVDNAKNILLQSANTDWTAETKLTRIKNPFTAGKCRNPCIPG